MFKDKTPQHIVCDTLSWLGLTIERVKREPILDQCIVIVSRFDKTNPFAAPVKLHVGRGQTMTQAINAAVHRFGAAIN